MKAGELKRRFLLERIGVRENHNAGTGHTNAWVFIYRLYDALEYIGVGQFAVIVEDK